MPVIKRALIAGVVLGLCLVGLTGCGGLGDDAVVVRVGRLAISKATVDHWTGVVERGGAFSGFRGEPSGGTPRRRALALLISSHWLIGEAARQGVSVPEATIQQALSEREQSPEFRRHLHATGQTISDVKLEMRAELAAEAIREKLARGAARFSQRELADYYRENGHRFSTLEVRSTDLIENQPSAAAAAALVGRIGSGRRFSRLAYHERVSRTPGFMRTPEKVKVVNAIFAARPGVVSPPMLLNGRWAVFVVRNVIPPKLKPLSSVRTEAVTQLNVARQHEVASRFTGEYEQRWRAWTSCRAGYVVPACSQSSAALGAYEDPFSPRAHPLLSEQALPGG